MIKMDHEVYVGGFGLRSTEFCMDGLTFSDVTGIGLVDYDDYEISYIPKLFII